MHILNNAVDKDSDIRAAVTYSNNFLLNTQPKMDSQSN